jgi:hypothetical protein
MRTLTIAAFLAVLAASSVQAQDPLPLDEMGEGTTTPEVPAKFVFNAPSAGVLTTAVRTAGGSDLVLYVCDEDGQPLPNGHSDADLDGVGTEQVATTLPGAGDYLVIVVVRGWGAEETQFRVGGTWLAIPGDEAPNDDSDGRPSAAQELEVGGNIEDSINRQAGDPWDWFVVTPGEAGSLTVVTRAPEGDLKLEYFASDRYYTAEERSDQDLGGTAGNESLSLQVEAGTTYYFRISAVYGDDQIDYKISAGLIPE